jgi:hypothetical protein
MCEKKFSDFSVPITRDIQEAFIHSLINEITWQANVALLTFFQNKLKRTDITRVEVSADLEKIAKIAVFNAKTGSEIYDAIEHEANHNDDVYVRIHGAEETAQLPLKHNLARPYVAKDPAFSGTARDSQWILFRQNFEGSWHAPYVYVYGRKSDDGPLDMENHAQVLPATQLEVAFNDRDTGIWKGTGLRFPQGVSEVPISRMTYNLQGRIYIFPGAGGQGSRVMAAAHKSVGERFAQEVNFFHESSRCMIVAIYKVVQDAEHGPKEAQLDSVQVTPFRKCANGPKAGNARLHVDELIQNLSQTDTVGTRLSFTPQTPLDTYAKQHLDAFDARPYRDGNMVRSTFEDGLVISVPEKIPQNSRFNMTFGAMMHGNSGAAFKEITIHFDQNAEVSRWSFSEYRLLA